MKMRSDSGPQIIIWLNMPSPHQEDLLREINRKFGGTLKVVYSDHLGDDRKGQGWAVEPSGYRYITLGNKIAAAQAVRLAFRHRGAVHVFGGAWSTLPNFFGSLLLRLLRADIAVYSEAPSRVFNDGIYSPRVSRLQSKTRYILDRAFSKVLLSEIRGVFAISSIAENWFRELGVPDEIIFPFGYFRSLPTASETPQNEPGPLDIVYVGTDNNRKGVDILFGALEPLWSEYPSLRLILAGAPSTETSLYTRLQKLGTGDRIRYLGPVGTDMVFPLMCSAFMVVAPSRFDGWGMAISEALMVGTPVIASDRCGATDLITPARNGLIFQAGDVLSLREAIESVLSNPELSNMLKKGAAETAKDMSVEAAAEFFVECCFNMRQGPARHRAIS